MAVYVGETGDTGLLGCGPTASFSVHMDSSADTPSGSVHKSRGDNMVQFEDMGCVGNKGGIVAMDVSCVEYV